MQPPRSDLKSFYRRARSRLEHPILWFDAAKRQLIAEAFAEAVQARRYTCFACAILSNHAHLIIRKHRDRAETMITELKKESAHRLRRLVDVPDNHPIWSADPFKKFLFTAEDVDRTVRYVRDNPVRERLGPQEFAFVKEYRGEWSGMRRK